MLSVLFSCLWSAVPVSTCMLISIQFNSICKVLFCKNLQSTRGVFVMHFSDITCQSNSLSFSWLPSLCLFGRCGFCSLPWCSLDSSLMPRYCRQTVETKSTSLSVQQRAFLTLQFTVFQLWSHPAIIQMKSFVPKMNHILS